MLESEETTFVKTRRHAETRDVRGDNCNNNFTKLFDKIPIKLINAFYNDAVLNTERQNFRWSSKFVACASNNFKYFMRLFTDVPSLHNILVRLECFCTCGTISPVSRVYCCCHPCKVIAFEIEGCGGPWSTRVAWALTNLW